MREGWGLCSEVLFYAPLVEGSSCFWEKVLRESVPKGEELSKFDWRTLTFSLLAPTALAQLVYRTHKHHTRTIHRQNVFCEFGTSQTPSSISAFHGNIPGVWMDGEWSWGQTGPVFRLGWGLPSTGGARAMANAIIYLVG